MTIYNKPDENVFASNAKQGEVSSFPDIGRGWGLSFDQTGGIPPMEWFNYLFKRADEKFGYLVQRGLSEWSETLEYPEGALVQYKNLTYKAKRANTNKKPEQADSQDWQRWGFTQSELKSATLTESGITQLSTSVNSDDETKAATPKAVKTAYDKAVEAKNAADNAQQTANDAQSSADSANNNANGRVSKGGDVMSGDLGIKSGDFSGVNLFNLEGGRVRLESLEHGNSAFFSKLSYILGGNLLDSILFPKSGINQVVAYQGWVNAVIAGLIKRYNGAGHAWYGQHYLGCDVYRIPFSDSAGLKIQLMKGDWWDGDWITTPETFDGYWFALGVDIGGGRDSIGFTFKDRNMMQIHTDHQTTAHILAIGWYGY